MIGRFVVALIVLGSSQVRAAAPIAIQPQAGPAPAPAAPGAAGGVQIVPVTAAPGPAGGAQDAPAPGPPRATSAGQLQLDPTSIQVKVGVSRCNGDAIRNIDIKAGEPYQYPTAPATRASALTSIASVAIAVLAIGAFD